MPYLTYSILLYLPLHYNEIKLGAASWTRTSHTQIFSLLLYLMSYRDIVLAERLRLELRNRITTIER